MSDVKFTGFIDVHTHILPGVDDGSKNMEQSLAMLELAYAEGIRTVFLTSHFDCYTERPSASELLEKTRVLQEEISKIHPDMKLLTGNEILYSYGVLEALTAGKALTMNNTSYVLVEFYPTEEYSVIKKALRQLMNAGYQPIIAHVERIRCLRNQWNLLDELKEQDVLFQMNASSLSGSFLDSKVRYCRKLIRESYIDLIATDAHDMDQRKPLYANAAKWIYENCGEEEMNYLCRECAELFMQ